MSGSGRAVLIVDGPSRTSAHMKGASSAVEFDRVPQLANELVQLAHIETRLALVLPSQFEKRESILVGSNATVSRLVQINEAALNDKHDQRRFW